MVLWQLSASVKMLLKKNFKILRAEIKQLVTCYTPRQLKHLSLSGNQNSNTARVNVLYIFKLHNFMCENVHVMRATQNPHASLMQWKNGINDIFDSEETLIFMFILFL